MFYKRLCKGLEDKGILIPETDNVYDRIDGDADWYLSLYDYNEEQYKLFQERGSVAGIKDVTTSTLLWDYDNAEDLEVAKLDAATLCFNLKTNLGINEKDIEITFSGMKGFGVKLKTLSRFTPQEVKSITKFLAKDTTIDPVIYNANRIIRIAGTRHPKSNLFKIPLTFQQLIHLPIDEIKLLASDIDNIDEDNFDWGEINLSEDVLKECLTTKEVQKKSETTSITCDIDWKHKPKFLSNCKFALQNGYFESGNRSTVLLMLASTYKNLGYDQEITYRMLKGVAELQSKRSGGERFPDEEIYNNVILQVYGPYWGGGQGTCKEEGWLRDYCQSLGEHKCTNDSEKTKSIQIDEVFKLFENYTVNLDKNVLYTGIQSLDKKCKLLVGTSNAIVAPPSLGKTSLLVSILNYNSLKDVQCIMFSYDMFHSALYLRMIQRHTGLQQNEIFHILKNDPIKSGEIKEILSQEYKNVHFCFQSGQSLEELKNTILEKEQSIGKKIKLMGIDYNELITSDFGEPTSASAHTAQGIRAICNENEICGITLVQPSKSFTTPADEITNFNAIKGSTSIAQSLTLLLGCSRPGHNPKTPETDNFFNITCLKNRNGPLFSLDFSWNGLEGRIGELDQYGRAELEQLRTLRDMEKKESKSQQWN